jgi:hypothetical protein
VGHIRAENQGYTWAPVDYRWRRAIIVKCAFVVILTPRRNNKGELRNIFPPPPVVSALREAPLSSNIELASIVKLPALPECVLLTVTCALSRAVKFPVLKVKSPPEPVPVVSAETIDPSPVRIIDSGAVIVKVPPVPLLKVEADI